MADKEIRFSPLTVLGDGLLLLCAMTGLAASFLSLYRIGEDVPLASTPQTVPLELCTARMGEFVLAAAILALLALCAWSLPRFRWAAAGGLAALWCFSLFLNWKTAVQGAGFTVQAVTTMFSQRVNWGRVFQYASTSTPARQGEAAGLFLLLTLAGLALVLGWAVARARRWWIVLLLTLPPLLPGLLADLYPSWPAFMTLAACWCAMLLTDLCKWAAPDRRGRLTLTVLPAVGAVLAVITLAFPREGYTRPDWAVRLEVDFRNSASRLSDFFHLDGPFRSTTTYVGAAEEADLAHAGPLRYSGRTVLRITSDYDGRLYLRGSSLAVYGDGVWKALPEGTYQEYLDSLDSPDSAAPPLLFPSLSARSTGNYTITVDNVGAVGTCVYAPSFLTPQDWAEAGMLPVEDSYLARLQGQWVHTMAFASLEPYGTGYIPAEADAYRDYVYAHYLDVPGEYREELAQLCIEHDIYGPIPYVGYFEFAEIPQEIVSWYGQYYESIETAQGIAAMLELRCEYDPEAPAAPEGEDPVLWFLNESHRGYCMHFASAATLMLRSLGIPARYVSGFTVDSLPNKTVTVPDRAAHAWVEVWVSGFGWYPVEVTPAAAFTWYEQGELATADQPSAPLPESGEPEPTPTPTQVPGAAQQPSAAPQDVTGDSPEEADDGPDFTVLIESAKRLAIAASVPLLLWLAQYLPKKYRALRLAGREPNRTALYAYGCLRRMERWGGRIDGRAVELAQKARFSQHTLTPGELDEMRGFVERERDRLSYVLAPAERLAFRCWWGRPKKKKNRGKSPKNGA